MGTKKNKSFYQINKLALYFKKRPDKWPKQEVQSLAKQTGLKRAQVYKWLWDQRNYAKNLEKGCISSHNENLSKQQQRAIKAFMGINKKRYRSIIFKACSQKYRIWVPEQADFASNFYLPYSTFSWSGQILKKQGWKLMRLRTPFNERYSQKKQKFSIMNENDSYGVKEEYFSGRK